MIHLRYQRRIASVHPGTERKRGKSRKRHRDLNPGRRRVPLSPDEGTLPLTPRRERGNTTVERVGLVPIMGAKDLHRSPPTPWTGFEPASVLANLTRSHGERLTIRPPRQVSEEPGGIRTRDFSRLKVELRSLVADSGPHPTRHRSGVTPDANFTKRSTSHRLRAAAGAATSEDGLEPPSHGQQPRAVPDWLLRP